MHSGEIDVAKELYQHYFLNELPERFHQYFDHRKAGIGERLVFEPYTKETFERTHRWMVEWGIFGDDSGRQRRVRGRRPRLAHRPARHTEGPGHAGPLNVCPVCWRGPPRFK